MRKERHTLKKEKPPMKKVKASVILSIISAIFLVLTAAGLWFGRKYLANPAIVRDMIGDHYLLGAIAMVLISACQVIIALLPGEAVELAAGFCFGPWMGALLCLLGIVLGSCTTILLVRKFGTRFVYAFYPKEKIDNLPILREPRKRDILTFILFVIPGTPKDLFTYAIGLTSMSIPRYLILTTLSRFPSVILSTLSGDAVGTKDYTAAIVFVIVTAVVSGIGLLIYNVILTRRQKKRQDDEGNQKES